MERTAAEVELEIDAFMGPHIKRARMALAFAGVLYVIVGYLDYARIADVRHVLDRVGSSDNSELEHLRKVVDNAYLLVVSSIVGGLVNIVLSVIGSQKKLKVFYAAVGVFAAISAVQLVLTDGALLFSWLWWLTAISIGLGFAAARKASRLRAQV